MKSQTSPNCPVNHCHQQKCQKKKSRSTKDIIHLWCSYRHHQLLHNRGRNHTSKLIITWRFQICPNLFIQASPQECEMSQASLVSLHLCIIDYQSGDKAIEFPSHHKQTHHTRTETHACNLLSFVSGQASSVQRTYLWSHPQRKLHRTFFRQSRQSTSNATYSTETHRWAYLHRWEGRLRRSSSWNVAAG